MEGLNDYHPVGLSPPENPLPYRTYRLEGKFLFIRCIIYESCQLQIGRFIVDTGSTLSIAADNSNYNDRLQILWLGWQGQELYWKLSLGGVRAKNMD